MMVLRAIGIFVVGLSLVTATRTSYAAPDAKLVVGPGSFVFPFLSGGELRRITVWYYRPAKAGADTPIVFVMHGASHAGENYP